MLSEAVFIQHELLSVLLYFLTINERFRDDNMKPLPYLCTVCMCMVVDIAVAFGGEEVEMIAPQNQRRSGRTSSASSQGTCKCVYVSSCRK